MFDIFFGWRGASKCKKQLRSAQSRLKLLKNKRSSIVRHLRRSVAELLKLGHQQNAFNWVEELIKDQNLIAAYDLLDQFAEFVVANISYIRKTKDCPNDIKEAVSTLIFASAICGDLPELRAVRKLFRERYGEDFAMTAVELSPGNLVNLEVKEKLCKKSVADNLKYRMMDEIAMDYNCCQCVPLALHHSCQLQQHRAKDNAKVAPLALEFSSQLQQQLAKDDAKEVDLTLQYSSQLQQQLVKDDANKVPSALEYSSQLQQQLAKDNDKEAPSALGYSSQLRHPPVDDVTKKQVIDNVKPKSHSPIELVVFNNGVKHNQKKVSAILSQESQPGLWDDDIKEFQSAMKEDENTLDQRSFLFMSSPDAMFKRGKMVEDINYGSRSCRGPPRSYRRAAKRLRKGSVPWDNNQTMKDEFEWYYGDPETHQQRKSHKKAVIPIEAEGLKTHQYCCVNVGSDLNQLGYACKNEKVFQCSLDQPCYFHASNDKESREKKTYDHRRNVTALVLFRTAALKQEMQYIASPSPQPPCPPPPPPVQQNNAGELGDKKIEGMEMVEMKWLSSAVSWTSSNSSSSRGANTSPVAYSRVMTIPLPNRPKYGDNVPRSKSFPIPKPCYVHPKLPDYDELEAKFKELKNTYLQFKNH